MFKIKSGINRNPEDPNYDLYQLALKVTGTRMFPTYINMDSSFNEPYGTEVSYMGCVQGQEVINYRVGYSTYVEGIERAYNRLMSLGAKEYIAGESKWLDTEAIQVTIYDSSQENYVSCKKFIKNPNKNNWRMLTMSNGRSLVATEDHPLPVLNRGRTFIRDLKIGDQIPVAKYPNYKRLDVSTENEDDLRLLAWFYGVMICDGNYNTTPVISLGLDEQDILAKLKKVSKLLDWDIKVIEHHRGPKGNYLDVRFNLGKERIPCINNFIELFQGRLKIDRSIPSFIFNSNYQIRSAFLAGMIDADGYANYHRDGRVANTSNFSLGSTNKELALQQAELVRSLGIPCVTYINHYYKKDQSKIRYVNEFGILPSVLLHMASEKKIRNALVGASRELTVPEYCKVMSIKECNYDGYSYDVETESDHFDVSGINSHNCRTRIASNVNGPAVANGRGNIAFVTINLPWIALEAKGNVDKFFEILESRMKLCEGQLIHRYNILKKLRRKDVPMNMSGLWLNSKDRPEEETIEESLKNGTLSFGYIGIYETLMALTGKGQHESQESQELGLRIAKFMYDYSVGCTERYHLNFSVIATPAESACHTLLKATRRAFGVVANVTDKEYFVNSCHVAPFARVTAEQKIKLEGPYHKYANAGHILYIEAGASPVGNIASIEKIINEACDADAGYIAINFPIDFCNGCGHLGVIPLEGCPQCGYTDIRRVRRITGYFSNYSNFNEGKLKELFDRTTHLGIPLGLNDVADAIVTNE